MRARESRASADLQVALDDLRVAEENNHAWRGEAERELRALDAKLKEVTARLLPTEEKLRGVSARLEHTENRADTAEAAARDAAEKLVLAEKELKEVSDKAAAAELRAQERVAEAEAQAREAVERYKNSSDFASECREAVMDAFIQGFERCKRRLSRLFKLGDLGHLQPADDEEGTPDAESGEEMPTGGGGGESLATGDSAVEPIKVEGVVAKDGHPGGH